MSLGRAFLVLAEAIGYHIASSPPNKTPQKGRYDSDHPWYIRIAVLVFTVQQPLVWLCALADILLSVAEQGYFPLSIKSSNYLKSTFCPHPVGIDREPEFHILPIPRPLTPLPSPNIHLTPVFVAGIFFALLGATIRATCFRTLGRFFTFDLTIMESHKLVRSGPYNIVRHPAYTGSLFMIFGICLANLTKGGWITECGVMGSGDLSLFLRMTIFAGLWGWWLAVGVHRAGAEDKELKKLFGKDWDAYAREVKWWFFPGLL
ncbi:hypothetical protein C8Q75DRAFT_795714 [Abortiporus biennis]|nr:hypothetical protein C8Q75DRAFT_795714 [Abortiporus biennis]